MSKDLDAVEPIGGGRDELVARAPTRQSSRSRGPRYGLSSAHTTNELMRTFTIDIVSPPAFPRDSQLPPAERAAC